MLEIDVRVVDRRPNQPSYFEQIEQAIAGDAAAALSDTKLTQTDWAALCDLPKDISQVPDTADVYLALQDEMYPAMPQIRDAWIQPYADRSMTVLILEDRSPMPTLLQAMKDEAVEPFQVLEWLYDMTKLWEVLDMHGQCSSVIEPSNLHIDADGIFCLQRLHADYPTHVPTLKEMGALWQTLFQQSQRTQLGPLSQLCADLETGDVSSLQDIQLQLEAIAANLQEPTFSFRDPEEVSFTDFAPTVPAANPTQPDTAMTESPSSINNLDDTGNDDVTLDASDVDEPPTLPPTLQPESVDPAPLETEDPVAESESSNRPTLAPPEMEDDEDDDSDDLPTIVLPMKLISLEDAGRTDIGQQRKHNEDYFSIRTRIRKIDSPMGRKLDAQGLYVLCDGMGGHAGGEVASALAVETLESYFEEHWVDGLPSDQELREAIYAANKAIYDLNQQNFRSGSGRMGTTLVMVLVQGTEAAIAHVGDSRLYRFTRRMGLEQLTVDHEVGQREIQRGVEVSLAYSRPDAYQLTQALGPRDQNFIDPDIAFIELTEDALFLLCSDGLTDDNLLEKHWRTHVEPMLSSQTNLEQALVQLIDLANHYNGHDNITGLAIRAKVRPDVAPPKRV
jgi:protein phosphatase